MPNVFFRKYQRVEEIRKSSGFSPIAQIREQGNLPDLGRNNNTELNRIFLRRNQNQEFSSFDNETAGETKKSYLAALFSKVKNEKKVEITESVSADNDCAICMSLMLEPYKLSCSHRVCK